MNNTYRKFFKVLRAWWITLMLFAFIPMVNAQVITGISVVPEGATQGPNDELTVTLYVDDFAAANTYRYYVVYKYQDPHNYQKVVELSHKHSPSDATPDVDIDRKSTRLNSSH